MLSAERIREAGEYVEWLRVAVHETAMPANDRVRAAGGCLAIAQSHHHAIVHLIEYGLYASSFALVRVAFEAYVRGEWLAICATESQVGAFLKFEEPPRIDDLLTALESTPVFDEQVLSRIKRQVWRTLCGFTHTGGHHVLRWCTSDGIEPNYLADEVDEMLSLAEVIGAMSVLGIAGLADDEQLAVQVRDKMLSRPNPSSGHPSAS